MNSRPRFPDCSVFDGRLQQAHVLFCQHFPTRVNLDAIAIESTHTIEIDSFVPRPQIDERYLDSPYYITPDDNVGQDAFAVIREAMRGKGMVALALSCSASASGSSCSSRGTRD